MYTFIIQSFISCRQSMSVSHVSELVHFTCTWIYRLSDNYFVFFGLISTNNIIEVPNLITESGLVYTFIIQSFISCRQSMSVSHVSELVHFTCTWIYWLSDIFFCLFWPHIHKQHHRGTKFDHRVWFSVHIHNPEFH